MERRINKNSMKLQLKNIRNGKIILFLIAIIIAFSSLYFANRLVKQLSDEEKKKIELWSEAIRQISINNLEDKDFTLVLQVIQNNSTIPVILTDTANNIISYRNVGNENKITNEFLNSSLQEMKLKNYIITIDLGNGNKNYVFYNESIILKKLKYFPYVQLSIIFIFIVLAYFIFSSSRKAEQNKVWVGLSKETAHQLGTPTSSLLGWSELIKEKLKDDPIAFELENDVKRLEKITDRFSKIGSKPVLIPENIDETIISVVNYFKKRTSDKIAFNINSSLVNNQLSISKTLFEWVIENLLKNAIDAMEGIGSISIHIYQVNKYINIDISDTGKGIAKAKFKTIFKPGYTTKTRGWGLGLSLSKRIIEEYHHGKIFVSESEIDKGTCFRISMKKK